MKVKCKICSSKIERDTAFKIVKEYKNNNVNFYYCSEDEYNELQNENIARDKCYDVIKGVLNIPLITPGMVKQLKTIREFYEYPIIAKTFKFKEEEIRWAIENKDFNSEFNKIKYILAIILNSIEDGKKLHIKELEEMERLFNKNENNSIDIDIMNEMEVIKPSRKRKINDISQFL